MLGFGLIDVYTCNFNVVTLVKSIKLTSMATNDTDIPKYNPDATILIFMLTALFIDSLDPFIHLKEKVA